MIRIDSLSKRHGGQILFLEAAAAVNRGDKIGLVGPNGSGKTTIFRLIAREEEPDDGQIAIDRGVSIGFFSQDVGEMKDQSVLEAALDGAGRVSDAARELHELEHALSDPERAHELDALIDALRRGADPFRGARRLSARGARARGARGPGLQRRAGRGRCRRALGRLEDAPRARAHPDHGARCAAARRADQPSRSRVDPLARGVAARVRGRARDHLARSRVPEPDGHADRRDRRAAS